MSKDMTKLLIEHDKAFVELSMTILALNYAIRGILLPIPKSSPRPRENK